ncbi:MAG TPA: hypothetical protein VMU48_00340 [Terracidiphilus sp.]|nr:hypothetical protein [Terracidiphilus sp.]
MMKLLAGLILVAGTAIGPPIDDPLMHFSWWGYVVVAALYTMVVFRGDLSREGPFILTKENARTPFAISCIHVTFLALLLWAARVTPYILPLLPRWMTDRIHARGINLTIADALFILATVAMNQIERRWLFVDSQADISGPENSTSQPSMTKRK